MGEHKGLTKETFLWALSRVALWQAPACVRTTDDEQGAIASDSPLGVAILLANLLALLEPAQRLKVTMGDAASLLEPATVDVFSRGEEMLRDIFIHFATDVRAPSAHSEGPVLSLRAMMRALNELSIMPGIVSHSVAFGSFLAVNAAGTALTFPGFLELIGRLADAGLASQPEFRTTAERLMELLQRISLSPSYERIAQTERIRRSGRTSARPIAGAEDLLGEATSAPGSLSRRVTAFASPANAATGMPPSSQGEGGSSIYWLPSTSAESGANAIPEDAPLEPLSVATLATATAVSALTDVGRAARLRAAGPVGTLDDAAAFDTQTAPEESDGVEALMLFMGGASLKHNHEGSSPDSLSESSRYARRLDDFSSQPLRDSPASARQSQPPTIMPLPASRPSSRSPSRSPAPNFSGPSAHELTAAQIPQPAVHAGSSHIVSEAARSISALTAASPESVSGASSIRTRSNVALMPSLREHATPPRAVDTGYTIANSARSQSFDSASIASSTMGTSTGLTAAPSTAIPGFVTEHLSTESLAARAITENLYGVPVGIPVPNIGKAAAAYARGGLSLGAAGLAPPRETLQNAHSTLPLRARSLSPRGFRTGGGASATALSPFVQLPAQSIDGRDSSTRISRPYFVDPAIVDACALHYAPLIPRLKPIFLLYARLQDPLNSGVLHPSNFVALLRDIDAIDGRVTTELVDFELSIMARDKSVIHRTAVAVASAAAGSGALPHAHPSHPPPGVALSSGGRLKLATTLALASLDNSHGPSSEAPLRAGAATGGGDERFAVAGGGGGAGRAGLDLDDFIEALARVSELVRRSQKIERAGEDASSKSHRSIASVSLAVSSPPGVQAHRAAITFFGDFLARRVLPLLAIAAAEDAAGLLASSPKVLEALDPHSKLLHRIFSFYVSNAVCVLSTRPFSPQFLR